MLFSIFFFKLSLSLHCSVISVKNSIKNYKNVKVWKKSMSIADWFLQIFFIVSSARSVRINFCFNSAADQSVSRTSSLLCSLCSWALKLLFFFFSRNVRSSPFEIRSHIMIYITSFNNERFSIFFITDMVHFYKPSGRTDLFKSSYIL